jgi:hypothetical protein
MAFTRLGRIVAALVVLFGCLNSFIGYLMVLHPEIAPQYFPNQTAHRPKVRQGFVGN